MSWALRVFYKKIYAHNLKNVQAGKPVMLAVNHPTAFADPILLCIFLDPPIYNMTRGDIFQKPFFRKLLESINMFPVFRYRDGYDNRDRNDAVFEYCSGNLKDGKTVAVYVEGEHHLNKRVLPVRKGIAYIAFYTMEKYKLNELQIVPIGCNYVQGDCVRDEVMINVGEPLSVLPYYQRSLENQAQALNQLCQDIEAQLKQLCYHLDNPSDEPLAEQLLELLRHEMPHKPLPVVEFSRRRFHTEKQLLDKLNTMNAADKDTLRQQTTAYWNKLGEKRLDDRAIMQHENYSWPAAILFFILGAIPFLAGFISAWPIKTMANALTKKTVKKREYVSSVLLGSGFLGAVIYYMLLFVGAMITLNPVVIALASILPILGWFQVFYREEWVRMISIARVRRHPALAELKNARPKLLDTM